MNEIEVREKQEAIAAADDALEHLNSARLILTYRCEDDTL